LALLREGLVHFPSKCTRATTSIAWMRSSKNVTMLQRRLDGAFLSANVVSRPSVQNLKARGASGTRLEIFLGSK
jgi:hypothetical protein